MQTSGVGRMNRGTVRPRRSPQRAAAAPPDVLGRDRTQTHEVRRPPMSLRDRAGGARRAGRSLGARGDRAAGAALTLASRTEWAAHIARAGPARLAGAPRSPRRRTAVGAALRGRWSP